MALARSAFDCIHVKSVKVVALMWGDKLAGRIVANFGDSGSVTATIHVWHGPLKNLPSTSGRAGGYGYDKFSAAVADALDRAKRDGFDFSEFEGFKVQGGSGDVEGPFVQLGYRYFTLI